MQERPDIDGAPQRPPADREQSCLPTEPQLAEDIVDEVGAESFPASDPPQWWAGPPD